MASHDTHFTAMWVTHITQEVTTSNEKYVYVKVREKMKTMNKAGDS